MQPQVLQARLKKLRHSLEKLSLDAILISKAENRFYLTGWPGDNESGYLLITSNKAFVVTDSRYTEEAVEKIPHFELREYGQAEDFWPKLFSETKVKRLGFEAKDLSVFSLKKLKSGAQVKFTPTTDVIETLRSIKDQSEVNLLKKAAAICDQAFDFVLKNLKPGQTERKVAWEMEKFMRVKGASKNAWEPLIVASGPNSSKVHYAAGDRKIKKGDQILLDWGCYYQGYASDISRVIFLGNPTAKQAKIYGLVEEAQRLGISKVKPGSKNKEIDLVSRKFLSKNSDFAFGHAVGHGVGLEVHELPAVNFRTKDKLQVGNVITVEPGIYEPGWGGVRLEDMVLVTKTGQEVLTKAPKKLQDIIVK